jgi:thiol:disulfide interchange protein
MSKKKNRKKKPNSQVLILIGLALLVGAVFLIKNTLAAETQEAINVTAPTASTTLPEELFDRAIEKGQPVLAFFHSLNCIPCMQMMDIVADVYPEFENEVVLVDVDVYDRQNQALLRRASIRTIPTVIFIDRSGEGEIYIGVMEAEQMQTTLSGLAGR